MVARVQLMDATPESETAVRAPETGEKPRDVNPPPTGSTTIRRRTAVATGGLLGSEEITLLTTDANGGPGPGWMQSDYSAGWYSDVQARPGGSACSVYFETASDHPLDTGALTGYWEAIGGSVHRP